MGVVGLKWVAVMGRGTKKLKSTGLQFCIVYFWDYFVRSFIADLRKVLRLNF